MAASGGGPLWGGAKLKQNGVALGVARGGGWAGLAWFACFRLVDYVLGWAVGFCFEAFGAPCFVLVVTCIRTVVRWIGVPRCLCTV